MKTNRSSIYKGMVFTTLITLGIQHYLSAQTLFQDDFDVHLVGPWQTSTHHAEVDYNYDYSADGIPSAPHSIGTSMGVKLSSSLWDPAGPAYVDIYPNVRLFGDYKISYDMWINVNGPFPAGGAGSTEYVETGFIGLSFAVNGGGGSAQDFQMHLDGVMQTPASGYYAAGTAGNAQDNAHPYYTGTFPGGQTAPASQTLEYAQQVGSLSVGNVGMAWRRVEIIKAGNTVIWSIDGLKIAEITNPSFGLGAGTYVRYLDPVAGPSDNLDLSFAIIDNYLVETFTVPEPSVVALGAFGLGALYLLRRR